MLNLDDPRAALRQAFGLIKEGRASDALAVLSPILEKDPDNAEAWWLLAHAAATAADSVLACQQVLSLRPGYAPALQMLSEQQLQTARDLIDQKQPREAYATIQAILEREPNNAEAWWLAALTASTTTESAAACQKVLAIAPDHALAQQKLTALQQTLSQSLKVKQKQIKRSKPTGKRRIGCVLALVGLAVLVFGSTLAFISLTGNNLGLPIGAQFNTQQDLGRVGLKPLIKVGTLVVDSTTDLYFTCGANSLVLIVVRFVTTNSSPGRAVRLYDPTHQLLMIGGPGTQQDHNTATLSTLLTDGGRYNLRLVGTAGSAQGAYVAQIVIADPGALSPPQSNQTSPGQ